MIPAVWAEEGRFGLGVVSFASNVTDSEELAPLLIEAARAELGSQASESDVDRRAGKLLLQSLLAVGVDPKTEQVMRNLLFAVLRGDGISPLETLKAVNYFLSQMVIQPKGVLAEVLAIPLCLAKLERLKQAGRLPPDAVFLRGVWSRRLRGFDVAGAPTFGEWREAADGLFCSVVPPGTSRARSQRERATRVPAAGDLLVFGVAEVKCYGRISRKKVAAQLERHIARLTGGLQLRDPSGRSVEREYPAENLWFGICNPGGIDAIAAADLSTRGPGTESASSFTNSLVRWTIGPRAVLRPATARPARPVFDAELPVNAGQLEEIATAMAYYTLGAMADQPEVDRSGWEWSANLAAALEAIPEDQLSPRAIGRREAILRRLVGQPALVESNDGTRIDSSSSVMRAGNSRTINRRQGCSPARRGR